MSVFAPKSGLSTAVAEYSLSAISGQSVIHTYKAPFQDLTEFKMAATLVCSLRGALKDAIFRRGAKDETASIHHPSRQARGSDDACGLMSGNAKAIKI